MIEPNFHPTVASASAFKLVLGQLNEPNFHSTVTSASAFKLVLSQLQVLEEVIC